MAEKQVVVLSVGMMSAVGLTTAETAASARASTMRFTSINWLDRYGEPISVAEVPRDGLPDLVEGVASASGMTARMARLLALGTMPLKECLKPLASRKTPIGLALALAEMDTPQPFKPEEFLKLFAKQMEGAFDATRSTCTFRGRAGGLLALEQARQELLEGKEEFVVAGGIDSYPHLYLLGRLDNEKRLKAARHLDGFVPGEGAAFVLLATAEKARTAGLAPLAVLFPAAEGLEEGHCYSEKPYLGDGLAQTMTKFFAEGCLKEPIAEVFASLNGESYWAKEWGVAYLRNQKAFLEGHGMHHPADCFGETGAACGPLLVGLAVEGMKQGYRRSPCLVYASSDYGQRAVLALALPQGR
jgi:3-oxoacyl-[acyl-carrier-protein] synthase I